MTHEYYACFHRVDQPAADVRVWRGPFTSFGEAKRAANIAPKVACDEKLGGLGLGSPRRIYRYGRRFVGTAQAFAHHGYVMPGQGSLAHMAAEALAFSRLYGAGPSKLATLVGSLRNDISALTLQAHTEVSMYYYTTGKAWAEGGMTITQAKRMAGIADSDRPDDTLVARSGVALFVHRYGGVFIGSAAALIAHNITNGPSLYEAARETREAKRKADAADREAKRRAHDDLLQSVNVAIVGGECLEVTGYVPGTKTRRWMVYEQPDGSVKFTRFAS